MTSLFSTLANHKPEITQVDDNLLQITVTIPSELLNDFSKLFEALSGFIRIIEREKRLNRFKQQSEDEFQRQQAEQAKQVYFKRISELFDFYTAQGLKRRSAIQRISADLRKDNHPWSSPDLVQSSLPAAGRPGRVGRPKGKRS